jgi:hypothetical protein
MAHDAIFLIALGNIFAVNKPAFLAYVEIVAYIFVNEIEESLLPCRKPGRRVGCCALGNEHE